MPPLLGWDWLKQNDVIVRPGTETAALYSQLDSTVIEDLADPEPIWVNLVRLVEIQPISMV